MRNAEKYAREHATIAQTQYAKYYNARAKDKAFQTGDQVVVLEKVWEWTKMPFGLTSAGNTFVRVVQTILHPIRDFSDSYVDDLSTFSDDFSGHLDHLRQFLTVVRSSGLTLNLKKCSFAKRCLFNSPNFNSPNSNYRVRIRVRDRVRVRVRDSVRRIEIRRTEKEPAKQWRSNI